MFVLSKIGEKYSENNKRIKFKTQISLCPYVSISGSILSTNNLFFLFKMVIVKREIYSTDPTASGIEHNLYF